jgi:small subunit ribosomal protein S19
MSRSLKKWFYVNAKLLSVIGKFNTQWEKKVIKVYDRACQIVPEMVWFTLAVHNGKQFISLYLTEDMIGHRLGEFVPTRSFRWHPF